LSTRIFNPENRKAYKLMETKSISYLGAWSRQEEIDELNKEIERLKREVEIRQGPTTPTERDPEGVPAPKVRQHASDDSGKDPSKIPSRKPTEKVGPFLNEQQATPSGDFKKGSPKIIDESSGDSD
jgi:hypothetical protein